MALRAIGLGIASIVLAFGFMGGNAEAVPIKVQISGTIDNIIGSSAEPYVGVSDSYSIEFSFDVGVDNLITGVSGSALINGHSADFTGSGALTSRNSSGSTALQTYNFPITPFGDGPGIGNRNITRIQITFQTPGPETMPAFDFFTADNVGIRQVNIAGSIEATGAVFFMRNIDVNPQGTVSVIPVPEPSTISLFAVALAAFSSARLRRQRSRPSN